MIDDTKWLVGKLEGRVRLLFPRERLNEDPTLLSRLETKFDVFSPPIGHWSRNECVMYPPIKEYKNEEV